MNGEMCRASDVEQGQERELKAISTDSQAADVNPLQRESFQQLRQEVDALRKKVTALEAADASRKEWEAQEREREHWEKMMEADLNMDFGWGGSGGINPFLLDAW